MRVVKSSNLSRSHYSIMKIYCKQLTSIHILIAAGRHELSGGKSENIIWSKEKMFRDICLIFWDRIFVPIRWPLGNLKTPTTETISNLRNVQTLEGSNISLRCRGYRPLPTQKLKVYTTKKPNLNQFQAFN